MPSTRYLLRRHPITHNALTIRAQSKSPPKNPDANPGTFYSAISNIDIAIKDGNPGAAAIRARYAQHCFMAHMDFHIGSGLTGIHDGGNLAEDLHFYGGQYGIITKKPSPGWQFTLVDATFEGQQKAAVKEHEAGLTLVRPHFKNVPTAVEIDPEYSDEFWIKDGRMENISGPAVVISNEKNFRTEVNFESVVCDRVPVFAKFRESGKTVAGPAAKYQVKTFSHGLTYADIGTKLEVKTSFDTAALTSMPSAVASDVPDLPERSEWANLQTLGVKGDGIADHTAALRNAVANHRTIYLPSGAYRIADTIQLKPDTVLIGLHPSATRLFIDDSTDRVGNVYIAAGQIYAYNPGGELIDTIDVPERPLGLVFGGKDGTTLFILARTSLYSFEAKAGER